jgi:hypothetical protein
MKKYYPAQEYSLLPPIILIKHIINKAFAHAKALKI